MPVLFLFSFVSLPTPRHSPRMLLGQQYTQWKSYIHKKFLVANPRLGCKGTTRAQDLKHGLHAFIVSRQRFYTSSKRLSEKIIMIKVQESNKIKIKWQKTRKGKRTTVKNGSIAIRYPVTLAKVGYCNFQNCSWAKFLLKISFGYFFHL